MPARVAALALAAIIAIILVLTVAVVFTGMYRLSRYNAMYKTVRARRAMVSDAYPGMKTGDIILFVATTHSPANSMLTQTFFSHAGVLMREGELVYISEAQPGLELMPDPARPRAEIHMGRGAELTPLLIRLKYYTGVPYLVRLSSALPPPVAEGLKRRAEALRRERYPYPTLAQIALGVLGWRTRSRHCFQHVAHLLDGAGLIPGGTLGSAGFVDVCREVCSLPGRCLSFGLTYEPPVQLVYNLPEEAPTAAAAGAARAYLGKN